MQKQRTGKKQWQYVRAILVPNTAGHFCHPLLVVRVIVWILWYERISNKELPDALDDFKYPPYGISDIKE